MLKLVTWCLFQQNNMPLSGPRIWTYGSFAFDKPLENVKQSAISDNLLTCDFNINFNDFAILSEDSKNFNLSIKESLLIARDKFILDKMVKSVPLELFIWTQFYCCTTFWLFFLIKCNILNVAVMTMLWWNKANTQ